MISGEDPDFGGFEDTLSFAYLCSTAPERDRHEIQASALAQMGEAPAGYQHMRRMQYRGGPDVSGLAEALGLE